MKKTRGKIFLVSVPLKRKDDMSTSKFWPEARVTYPERLVPGRAAGTQDESVCKRTKDFPTKIIPMHNKNILPIKIGHSELLVPCLWLFLKEIYLQLKPIDINLQKLFNFGTLVHTVLVSVRILINKKRNEFHRIAKRNGVSRNYKTAFNDGHPKTLFIEIFWKGTLNT
jgi:hypothetical protein